MNSKMHKEEKRRKFHEALLNKLYPPPPPSKNDLDEEEEEEEEEEELADLNFIKDGFDDDSSSTSGGESECEQKEKKKLTRAQRKRLRKKKLKEAASASASCRRKIIGPLLPSASADQDGGNDDEISKQSASEVQNLNSLVDKPGKLNSSSTIQKKLKHRRMAKKLKQNNVGSICHDEADSSLL